MPEVQPIERLLPRPKRARSTGGQFPASDEPVVGLEGDWSGGSLAERMLGELGRALAALTRRPRLSTEGDGPPRVVLRLDRQSPRVQAYELTVARDRIEIVGSDPVGLFYGLRTLGQWVALHHREVARFRSVPTLEVEDWPDFRYRGLMLDISRNRVPRMDRLIELVERLADLKFNQLQLYTEHTFAYAGHEVVWQGASPMTPDEIRDLDAYCHERFIELVPNQNSFGHMHRWLVHDPYRELAECPDGIDHPFARAREPFSLCATDERSFDLLADLYDQLLPNFRSRSINVGLDETLDLGKGRSREACAARGTTAVYLEYLTRVHRLLTERGYRMQFWGDIALAEPDSADGLSEQALEPGALPRDAVALIWGYEADHPFELQCQKMKATGLEYWVCPGTSSWNSLAGRLDEAISNITHAARAGRLEGASGLLLTDWGDFGHLQPPAVSWPGYLTASERSWNADGKRVLDDDTMTALLAQWGFPSDSVAPQERVELASVLMQLARVYRSTGARHRNGSALFYLLIFPDAKLDHPRFAGLDDEALAEARAVITRALAELPDSGLVARELRWVGQALDLAARLGSARIAAGGATVAELPRAVASTLDRDLRTLCRELPALWRERSREGGLKASLEWLESLARELSC